MERPTCRTCPYWEPVDENDEIYPIGSEDREEHNSAICRRNAPVGSMEEDGSPMTIKKYNGQYHYEWPETSSEETCGEHPDFPAYIRSLKATAPRAPA